MREELLNKMEQGLDDLGNSQPMWMAKDAKIKSHLPETCFREKATGVTVQSFANTSERSKVQNIQSHKRLFDEIKSMT